MAGPVDERIPWKKQQLLEDMEHTGIHGSLVYHWLSREYDPSYGNKELLDLCQDEQRLFPCAVLLPHHAREFPPPNQFVPTLRPQGYFATKIFPRRHNYTFDIDVCGAMLEALQQEQIPLLIDIGIYHDDQQTTFAEIKQLCRAFPELPILLQKARWESTRDVLALMEQTKHTYIEFSSFQIHYGLEFMASEIGVERLVLGTEWPFKSPGAARSFIDYCELEEADKALVAGGNLARLLHLEQLPPAYSKKDQGTILSLVKKGRPLDHIPVIDPHTHVLHDGLMGAGYIPMPYGDAEHMIRRYRRLGVDLFCCSSWIGIWIDYRRGNALIRTLTERYPDDIIGYATIDPRKSDDYKADIALCHDTYQFPGLKPYNPRVGLPYNDPAYDLWYQKGNAIGGFVKLHQTAVGDNYLEEIADISERFPNMNYLLAHSGWNWEIARSRVALARERPNIFLDLTFTSVLHGVIEYFVEEGLADKVLFCSDAPMRDPIPQLGWVAYSRIEESEKEMILGGNMIRVLQHAGVSVTRRINQNR